MNNNVLKYRQGNTAVIDGREIVLFCSNDYLGLSCHPRIKAAIADALDRYGSGTGGGPGSTGTTDLHLELAYRIAEFKHRDKAILFTSGYSANMAIHQSLSDKNTLYIMDSRSHPSAVDGARLAAGASSSVDLKRYQHWDMKSLEENLYRERFASEHLETGGIETGKNKTEVNDLQLHRRIVVSTPSVFTVDADVAPLKELMKLKEKYDFILILDEAHATGCIGENGRGLEEHSELINSADFIMGTFSKALGSQGGFVAFNCESEKLLHSELRSFEHSTSLSAVNCAAANEALKVLSEQKYESNESVMERLLYIKNKICDAFKQRSLPLIVDDSMVLLYPCENTEGAIQYLKESGYLVIDVIACRGGENISCLRIIPMVLHTEEQIEGFADAVKEFSG